MNTQNTKFDLSSAEHDALFEMSLGKLMDEIRLADSAHDREKLAVTKEVLNFRITGGVRLC